MKVSSINEITTQTQSALLPADEKSVKKFSVAKKNRNYTKQYATGVAFKGSGIDFSKRFWFKFRKLSDYMKQPSEMTNALIAMIGTGAIAPFAIMCSPKKKCKGEQDKKADKDKKFFQALRQPVSAFLAFAFQVPTTIGIAAGLNHLAYQKQCRFFDDDILGHLIPDKKYLRKRAIKAMNSSEDSGLRKAWEEELKIAENEEYITTELRKQIQNEYKEVQIDISDEELEKLVQDKNNRRNFIADKMADAKQENRINEKVKELLDKNIEIKDEDLVTENYQKLAKQRFKDDFARIKQEANLNWFDKFIEMMGFSNSKLNTLNGQIKALAQEKGLVLIKEDIANGKMPDILNDETARLKKFIENRIDKAKKLYANKIFWLTLVTNLFMVAISCVALNWLHPKFADFVDNIKDKRNAHKASDDKKVEVRA